MIHPANSRAPMHRIYPSLKPKSRPSRRETEFSCRFQTAIPPIDRLDHYRVHERLRPTKQANAGSDADPASCVRLPGNLISTEIMCMAIPID